MQPFPGTGLLPIKVTGSISRKVNIFNICYWLFGHIADLEVPAPAERPSRRIGLWEKTCFEFFIAERNSSRYWEFNLSPSGDWNVFRLESYRQNLVEETTFSIFPFSILKRSDSLRLVLEFDLSIIIPTDQALEIAISAVIKTGQGDVTLWALVHPGPEADFHRRDSFIIKC